MKPEEPDEQLWEMARLDDPDGAEEGGGLSDGTLRAWREGRLPEAETEDVEARLSRSPSARARLRELAGLETGAPGPLRAELRQRVLAGFGKPERRRPQRWIPMAAAAALAASLIFAVIFLRAPSGLPPGLAYDVSARGLAAERSTAPDPADITGPVQAYPDTPVWLEVSPQGAAEEDVEFGLYRVREGRLERIETGPSLTVETNRGAARFQALAEDLVGPRPGIRDVYVVVSREGDLPAGGSLRPGEDPRLRLAGEDGQRLVYTQSIQIRKGPPS